MTFGSTTGEAFMPARYEEGILPHGVEGYLDEEREGNLGRSDPDDASG